MSPPPRPYQFAHKATGACWHLPGQVRARTIALAGPWLVRWRLDGVGLGRVLAARSGGLWRLPLGDAV